MTLIYLIYSLISQRGERLLEPPSTFLLPLWLFSTGFSHGHAKLALIAPCLSKNGEFNTHPRKTPDILTRELSPFQFYAVQQSGLGHCLSPNPKRGEIQLSVWLVAILTKFHRSLWIVNYSFQVN